MTAPAEARSPGRRRGTPSDRDTEVFRHYTLAAAGRTPTHRKETPITATPTTSPCPHLVFGYRPCLRKHGHTGMHTATFKD